MSLRSIFGSTENGIGFFLVCGTVLLMVGVCTIKSIGGANIEYSEGSRTGTITKLSKKGWIWRTWEGELDLHRLRSSGGDNPTTVSDVFHFSVSDYAVVHPLMNAQALRVGVTLKYKQYLLRGWKYGATSYDVVEVIEEKSERSVKAVERFPVD